MKQVLFLVHGMGESALGGLGQPGSGQWARDLEQGLRAAAAAYPRVDPASIVFVPITYDDVFQSHAATWQELAGALAGTDLAPLTQWMRSAAGGDFLWGSLGDVIQYRAFPTVRSHVITHVVTQIAKAVQHHGLGGQASYHVLAHSLGTAVAHDALHKLATTPIDGNRALMPPGFSFDTLMALANVSRLVWATDASFYAHTRVRPPGCGLPAAECAVKTYISVRHVADPIPSVVRFARKSWSPDNFYDLELRHVRELNVHAFSHYLASPWVTDTLLYRMFGGAAVTRAATLKRIQGFPDYLGPRAAALGALVQTVEAALDKLSAQAEGTFAYDLDDIGRALWQQRELFSQALRGT